MTREEPLSRARAPPGGATWCILLLEPRHCLDWASPAATNHCQPRSMSDSEDGVCRPFAGDRVNSQPRAAREALGLLATISRHFLPPPCGYSFPFLIKPPSLTLSSGHYLGLCLNLCFLNCNSAIPNKCALPLMSAF